MSCLRERRFNIIQSVSSEETPDWILTLKLEEQKKTDERERERMGTCFSKEWRERGKVGVYTELVMFTQIKKSGGYIIIYFNRNIGSIYVMTL